MNFHQEKVSGINVAIVNQGQNDISSLGNALADAGMIVDCMNKLSSSAARKISTHAQCLIIETDRYKDICRVQEIINTNQKSTTVIGISDRSPVWFLDKIADLSYPDHIIDLHMPEFDKWVIANVIKLTDNNYSGLRFYLPPGTETKSLQINDSKQKEQYIKTVMDHFSDNNVRLRTLHDIEEILDEMITNAIYNAPVDIKGNRLYQHRDRKESVKLTDKQAGTLSYAADDRKIYLSVLDPFGSLTKERLLTYLGKCFKEDHVYVENKAGGAGIGLHKILRMSHNFVVNIDPGKYTEVIACISLSASQQNQETASMNLFVKDKKNAKI